jgi:hypothetical protein
MTNKNLTLIDSTKLDNGAEVLLYTTTSKTLEYKDRFHRDDQPVWVYLPNEIVDKIAAEKSFALIVAPVYRKPGQFACISAFLELRGPTKNGYPSDTFGPKKIQTDVTTFENPINLIADIPYELEKFIQDSRNWAMNKNQRYD